MNTVYIAREVAIIVHIWVKYALRKKVCPLQTCSPIHMHSFVQGAWHTCVVHEDNLLGVEQLLGNEQGPDDVVCHAAYNTGSYYINCCIVT